MDKYRAVGEYDISNDANPQQTIFSDQKRLMDTTAELMEAAVASKQSTLH